MKIKLLHRLFLGSALLLSSQLFSPLVLANDSPAAKPDFASYTSALKQEALSRGYDASLLDAVFSSLQFHERVVSADRSQPEVVETLDTYLPKRVSETRIRMARERYQQYQPQLEEIGKRYGVQPRFIVALWGLESSFGRFQGNYSIPSALATLAYEGRRETFFRTEFFHALDILAQGHIDLDNMKGSWAGAMWDKVSLCQALFCLMPRTAMVTVRKISGLMSWMCLPLLLTISSSKAGITAKPGVAK